MVRLDTSIYQKQFQDSIVRLTKVPNFREMFNNSFNCHFTDFLVAGIEWKLVFWKTVLDGQDTMTLTLKPLFKIFGSYEIRGVLTLINDDLEKCVSYRFDGTYGLRNDIRAEHMITTDRLFTDGFLVPERYLSVMVEFRVDSFLKKDGIRRFNFHDPMTEAVKISCISWNRPFYVKRFMLKLQLGTYDCYLGNGEEEIQLGEGTDDESFEAFLQLIHGTYFASLDFTIPELAIPIAFDEECWNILKLCERQLIHKDRVNYHTAITYGFDYYFKHLLKKLKTLEEVKAALGTYSFDNTTGEIRKALVKKFFSLCDISK